MDSSSSGRGGFTPRGRGRGNTPQTTPGSVLSSGRGSGSGSGILNSTSASKTNDNPNANNITKYQPGPGAGYPGPDSDYDDDMDEGMFGPGPSHSGASLSMVPMALQSNSKTSTSSRIGQSGKKPASNMSQANINPRSMLPPIPEVSYERSCQVAKSINLAWNTGPRNIDIVASGICDTLRKEFSLAKNPFATALDLMVYSTDFFSYRKGSKFLAMEVMLEFKKWMVDQEKIIENFSGRYLKPTLQICAFEIVLRQRNSDLVKTVFEIFQLKKMAKDFIVSIKQFCENGQYKEACIASAVLELYDQFDIHSFVIPLLLQDRETIALEYLMGSKTAQEGVMDFLDGIIGNRNQIPCLTYFRDYAMSRKIENVIYDKLDFKPLSKLVGRLAAKFSMDVLGCANLGRDKKLGMIKHLIYRKCQMNEAFSDDALHELLDSTVGSDPELIEEVMTRLRREGDNVATARFGIRHNYPPDKCAYDVQVEMNKINPNITPAELPKEQAWDEDWDITEEEIRQKKNERYVQNKGPSVVKPTTISLTQDTSTGSYENSQEMLVEIPLLPKPKVYRNKCSKSNVHLITSIVEIHGFLEYIKEAINKFQSAGNGNGYAFGHLIVGIDCEWKPVVAEASGVALIQIAMINDIFLLDTFTLMKSNLDVEQIRQVFEKLVKEFFANEEIIKIGYGFDSDFRMLMKTHPAFLDLKTKIKSLLDLATLSKELVKTHPAFFPFSSNGLDLSGLSELVFLCTGEQVNKDEQFSDWEKRPLRPAQVEYAATDAYCLLDIWRTIENRAHGLKINLQEISTRLMKESIKKQDRMKKLTAAQIIRTARDGTVTTVIPVESPFRFTKRNAKEVKLICDNMLQGLGKHLRACGINTVILENHESHTRAAQIALQENRGVLTTGKIYNLLAGLVPIGHCLGLTSDNVVDQLREVITWFNIVITNDDIYTICQKCNSNKFIKIAGSSLAKLGRDIGRFPKQLHRPGTVEEDALFQNGVIEIDSAGESQITTSSSSTPKRNWALLPESDLTINRDTRIIMTKSCAAVGILSIPTEVFDYVDEFYICDGCGKCYWIGGQFRRGFERIQEITSATN